MSANAQDINLNDNRGPSIITVSVIFIVLATLLLICRAISRRLRLDSFDASDYTLLLGLLGAWVTFAAVVIMVRHGFGRHVETVTVENLRMVFIGIYIAQISYVLTLAIVKISILLLYRSIFPGSRFKILTYFLGAFSLAWGIALTLVEIFSCIPIRAFWDANIAATCLSIKTIFVIITLLNIGNDVAILCLPIPNVWRLKMSFRAKLGVSAMFLLGSFVCFVSTLRLVYTFRLDLTDPTWGISHVTFWSIIEVSVAIMSACLPTLRPLFTDLSKTCCCILSTRSRVPKLAIVELTPGTFGKTKIKDFRRLPNDPLQHLWHPQPVMMGTTISTGNSNVERGHALPLEIVVRFKVLSSATSESQVPENPKLPPLSPERTEQGG